MLGGFLTLFVSLSMRGQLSRVPGLALYPDFLSEAEGVIAATAARRLSRSAAAAAKGMVGSTSRNHNVNQREEYVRVTLQDDDDAGTRRADTADAATETLLPRPEDGGQPAKR